MSGTDGATETWTTRRLLAWMSDAFTKKGLDAPRLCAEMLMAHVAGVNRLKLYTDPDRPAAPLEREQLRDLVKRALNHEPIQYLVGEAWFFGLPFAVDRRVLIPRPSTETIVETVLQHARATGAVGPRAKRGADPAALDEPTGEGLLLADVCTGSGCIALSLAKHMVGTRVLATDLSTDALDVARMNAERHGVRERTEFLQGDLLEPLLNHPGVREGSLAFLVSNPPYIPDHEWAEVEPNVKEHEPVMALRAGADGLDLIRPLIEQAPSLLAPGGLLLIEHAASHADAVLALAEQSNMLTNARILRDIDGLPRVLVAERIAAHA